MLVSRVSCPGCELGAVEAFVVAQDVAGVSCRDEDCPGYIGCCSMLPRRVVVAGGHIRIAKLLKSLGMSC
jgi:hypothetical protein